MSGYKGVECQSLEKDDDDIIEVNCYSEKLNFIVENVDLLWRCFERAEIVIEANYFCYRGI